MVDFSYLSLGGGVQSSALVEMIVEGVLAPVDAVIFADTGDEPVYVYEQVSYLCARLASVGIPLVFVSGGNMVDDLALGRRFVALPLFTRYIDKTVSGFGKVADMVNVGRLKRQCTSEYKILPIERFVRSILLSRGLALRDPIGRIYARDGVSVDCHLGISLDEWQRMKPSKVGFITNRFPLIDRRLTRKNCIDWLLARGLPVPHKSSCRRCPYHSDSHWLKMSQDSPDDFAHVVAFDDSLRDGSSRIGTTARGDVFLHSSCKPLSQVDFSPKSPPPSLFDSPPDACDEGYCFV